MASYYDILGLSKNADAKEVTRAFRKQARKYHPDLNPGDKEAEDKFKRINEAHEVLSNEETRKKYDRYGDQWKNAARLDSQFGGRGGSPFGRAETASGGLGSNLFEGLEDLLGQFGKRARPRRVEVEAKVTLNEAYTGTKLLVTVSLGADQRRIEVAIPPGVDNGSVVQVSLSDGPKLSIKVSVSPNKRFKRTRMDLFTEVKVPFDVAVLGGETEVRTLKGKVRMKVPPESQNGQKIRLAGQGMPKLGDASNRGALYVTLRPELPKDLTDEERELFEKLSELRAGRE